MWCGSPKVLSVSLQNYLKMCMYFFLVYFWVWDSSWITFWEWFVGCELFSLLHFLSYIVILFASVPICSFYFLQILPVTVIFIFILLLKAGNLFLSPLVIWLNNHMAVYGQWGAFIIKYFFSSNFCKSLTFFCLQMKFLLL